jgi:hypothetical protein
MAFPLKRVLFFLFAILVFQASAALAVPLSSGMNGQDAAAVSATGSTADGEATEAGAGIVDNQELALGADASEVSGPHSAEFATGGTAEMRVGAKSKSPGWLRPAAAVGAGSSIFAILASGGKGKGGVSAEGNGSVTMGSSGSGGTTSVGGGKGDDPPSAVPEPGTMLLMGLGVAGYLGRRKLAKE